MFMFIVFLVLAVIVVTTYGLFMYDMYNKDKWFGKPIILRVEFTIVLIIVFILMLLNSR